jgi:CheY-like chemotaxis protein/HPt (histidine-containing phosphotransfer) domain-containing protein
MMLSSADSAEDVERCRACGIESYLTKPISQSELFDAVVSTVVARDFRREEPTSPLTIPTTAAAVPSHRTLNVLLAEDNPVNRELAVALLTTLGHRVHMAPDGQALLAALDANPDHFDLVLMDVQMPRLDGLEATREIRRREQIQATGEPAAVRRLPIIALTAHAMKGDRETCLAAGMDDYVTKPIRRRELVAAIERIRTLVPPVPEAPSTALEQSSFDRTRLHEELSGNAGLLRRLAEAYFEHTPGVLQSLRAAVAAGNLKELEQAAHTLKGSLNHFAAAPAARLARLAEEAAARGHGKEAALHVSALEPELARFESALRMEVSIH